jgi:Flp pilus assembly protein TadG
MISRRLVRSAKAFWSGAEGDRGLMAPIFGIALVVLVGMAGSAIDVGRVMWVQRQLQASADAAALAGAQSVAFDTSKAQADALDFSGLAGKKNAVLGAQSVALVGGQATVKCVTSVKPVCAGTKTGANVIKVTQEAVVEMYFLRVVGMDTMTPRATATASARGGSGRSLDVMIVLDATASMSNESGNCNITNGKKIDCARAGAYALMQGLNPALDQVGMMVFPGLSEAGVTANTTCGGSLGSSDVKNYKQVAAQFDAPTPSATYTVFGLTSAYAVNGSLNGQSAAMRAVGHGVDAQGKKCTSGVQAKGGAGTYFADVIERARLALNASARPNSQKVMVILSDGDATTDADNLPSSAVVTKTTTNCNRWGNCSTSTTTRPDKLCQRAIASARKAAADSIWVYSVAYRAQKSGGCEYDDQGLQDVSLPNLSACDTMRELASDSTKFYSDGTKSTECVGTGGSNTNLITLFQNISSDLTMPRLIPDDTV